MHFLVKNIAERTELDTETVNAVLSEAAFQMRADYPEAAEALDTAVDAAQPVNPDAATLPL